MPIELKVISIAVYVILNLITTGVALQCMNEKSYMFLGIGVVMLVAVVAINSIILRKLVLPRFKKEDTNE